MTKIDAIDKWAKLFGLGEITGIELAGEKKGYRANKETNKMLSELYKVRDGIWRPVDTAFTSIGQQDNLFTPLQLVNYIGALANGGKLYKPHLIKRVVRYDGSIVNETLKEYEQLPVKKENMDAVIRGMAEVANSADGTAHEAFKDFPANMMPAGKTGTAETGHSKQSSNALFLCFAPANDPKVAVAVAVERGAWGSNAALIAHDILEEYFHLNKQEEVDDRIITEDVVFTR
jgi:penicillin-binding protein 2